MQSLKFSELKIGEFFRLAPDSPSYRKSSYFGYFFDSVMGEVQCKQDMLVYPIVPHTDVPVSHV
jgi:hypothetical protein